MSCGKEAESRIDAYETGNIKAISAEHVFGKYKKWMLILDAASDSFSLIA